MSVEQTAFAIPLVLGLVVAFVPWRWTWKALLAGIAIALITSLGGQDAGDMAGMYVIYFLVMALPVILVGWALGKALVLLFFRRRNGRDVSAR